MKESIESFIEIGFQCAICGHFEPCYEDLRKHVLKKHPNYDDRRISDLAVVGYRCKECEHFKKDYRDIGEHIRTFHNEKVTQSPRHKVAKEVRRP